MMNAAKYILFGFVFFVGISLFGQTDEIRLEIPSEETLIFDGKRLNYTGSNTLFGQDVGEYLPNGSTGNTYIGNQSGQGFVNYTIPRYNNTAIGAYAGINGLGSGNVFIGRYAGTNENGDNKLYIHNSIGTPLIYGDFSTRVLEINDNLTVANVATIEDSLVVWSSSPGLTLRTGPASSTVDRFHIAYDSAGDKLTISEEGVTGNVFEIKDGEIYLPQYTGINFRDINVDSQGKLVLAPKRNRNYNFYSFQNEVVYSGYKKTTLGVNLADGTVMTGIEAYVMDNDSGTGLLSNTIYITLWRKSKTSNVGIGEQIYRIDGVFTATDVFTLQSDYTPTTAGRNIIDNSQWIYLLEVYYCDECGFREVTLLD